MVFFIKVGPFMITAELEFCSIGLNIRGNLPW